MQSLTSRLHTRILSHIPKCDKTRFLWLKVDREDYGYEIFGRLGFRASPKWPARSGQWPSVSSDVFPGLYWGYRLPQATRFLPSSNPKLSVDHTATEEGGRGLKGGGGWDGDWEGRVAGKTKREPSQRPLGIDRQPSWKLDQTIARASRIDINEAGLQHWFGEGRKWDGEGVGE